MMTGLLGAVYHWTGRHTSAKFPSMAKLSVARESLINAACELFRARGYEGVGVAELLEKSGAPRGSLYFHFPGGKEEIGVEAVRRVGESVAEQFRGLHESGVDMNTFIDRVFATTAKTVKDRCFEASCPIAATAAGLGKHNPQLAEAVRDMFTSWEREITVAAVARGMKPKNAAEFATAMLTCIEGALIVSKAQQTVAAHTASAKALKAMAAALRPVTA
jgi:TetR/AcrR family transcriptional repressor of lmrAB and yxaGH operons